MKKYISVLLLLMGISFVSCDSKDDDWACIMPSPNEQITVLNVDYMTNEFLGGHHIDLPNGNNIEFELDFKYNLPGDFGDITFYDKANNQKLFAGTIIWMGKGERTYPEKILPAEGFLHLKKVNVDKPQFIFLWDEEMKEHPLYDVDSEGIWDSIRTIDKVNCCLMANPSAPIYLYLYRPSVGDGNPNDWYWLVFLRDYYYINS